MPINYNSSGTHEATGAVGPYLSKCNAKSQLFLKLRLCSYAGTRPKKCKLPDVGTGGQFSALLNVAVHCLIEHLRLAAILSPPRNGLSAFAVT